MFYNIPMKVSTSLFLTDILPHKKKLIHKILKNKIFDGHSHSEVFESLKKSGVEGIELLLPLHATFEDMEEVNSLLKVYGIKVLSLHQPLRLLGTTKISEVKKLFQMADILGAKIVVLHLASAGRQIYQKKYIDEIHKLEKQYGIKAGFENREKHIASFLNTAAWHPQKFSELVEKNNFFVTLDTTHTAQVGADIIDFYKLNKQRVVNIHIGDYKKRPLGNVLFLFAGRHLPLGKGVIPVKEFLRTLQHEHYNGLVTMEIHTDLKGICQSAEIIHSAIHTN